MTSTFNSKNQDSFVKKIKTTLVAGLIIAALFLVIGNGGNIIWFPPMVVFSLVGLTITIAIIYPFIWQNLERRDRINSAKIYGILYVIIRYGIAMNLASFGWKKIFGLQFLVPEEIANQPMNKQTGEWLTWYYFGFSKTFGFLIALIQIIGSYLLLFRRTLLLGSVLLFAFMLNLTLINIFYHLNMGALLQSVITTFGILFLISLEYSKIKLFLFTSNSNLPTITISKQIVKNCLRLSVIVISLLFTIYLKTLLKK